MRVLDALLPRIAHFYGESVGAAGLAVTAYSGSYSLCQLFYGPLGDRVGPYRIITFSAGFSSVAAIGCALAPTMTALVVLRLIAGAVAAAIGPLAVAWISGATAIEHRSFVLANVTGASIVGATAGQIGGGFIGQVAGWQMSFLLVALMFGTTFVVLAAAGQGRPQMRELGRHRHGDRHSSRAIFAMLLRRAPVRLVLAAVAVEGFATYLSFTYTSALLHRTLDVGLAAVAVLIACFGLGGLCFVLVARQLVAAIPDRGRARIGGSLLGAGFLALALAHLSVVAGMALLVLGFGFFMIHNILQVRATKMAPDAPGTAMSLFAATFFLSQSLGALVGGWIFDRAGGLTSFGISGILLIMLGWMMGRAMDADRNVAAVGPDAGKPTSL